MFAPRLIGLPRLVSVVAVVISADLIHIGDHVGCFCLIIAAIPEMCGVDIDVPS